MLSACSRLTRRSFLKSSLLLLGDIRADSLIGSEATPGELSLQPLLEWDVRLDFHLDPPISGWRAVDSHLFSYRSTDGEYSLLIKIDQTRAGSIAVQFSL